MRLWKVFLACFPELFVVGHSAEWIYKGSIQYVIYLSGNYRGCEGDVSCLLVSRSRKFEFGISVIL